MRQRKWVFYRVVLYLGITAATVLFFGMLYDTLFHYTEQWRNTTTQIVIFMTALQILFYFLCVRLVHQYISKRLRPNKWFNIWFVALLITNVCFAISLLLFLVTYSFSEIFFRNYGHPDKWDYSAVSILGVYTFITIYIPAASIVLRRYNRYQVNNDEETWLQQLGSHPLNE